MLRISSFILCLLCAQALAQERVRPETLNKPVSCMPASQLVDILKKEFKETPRFYSKNDMADSVIILLESPEDTWTLIEMNPEMGCILAVGKHMKEIPGKPNT